jgi:hypothetical protein
MSESSESHAQPETKSQTDTAPAADGETSANSGWNSDQPIAREQQMVFGTDGDLEPDGDSVETSLEAFGADVDHSDGSAQVAEPKATRFGVDDRVETSKRTESDQHSLFADVNDDQQTLGGDDAATRCLFGDDSDDDEEET